jgi:hypothetical protein
MLAILTTQTDFVGATTTTTTTTAAATTESNYYGPVTTADFMTFNATVPDTTLPFLGLSEEELEDRERWVDKFQFAGGVERPLKPAALANQPTGGAYTYSFQETTFARRLHRMCLERAFRNLTNPNLDPDYVKRAFRFTFCFSNRRRMLQRFQEMLKRRAGESLENFHVPFFHIGGAGTHFPRRDDRGNPVYPPNILSPARAFGPQPLVQVETPRLETSTQDMLENIGFGGQWYDSHDVEEYLKTKGIFLDGHSSYVDLDPDVVWPLVRPAAHSPSSSAVAPLSTDNGSTSTSGRSPHLDPGVARTPSPPAAVADPLYDRFMAHELGDLYGQQPSSSSSLFAPTATTSASDGLFANPDNNNNNNNNNNKAFGPADPWADFAAAVGAPTTNPTSTPTFQSLMDRQRQSSLTFDVDQFLENMVEESACLGRAPGFRKETVDKALELSLQEGY